MSKTVTIKVFPFEELDDEAKQKALEYFYDLNVSHDWWEHLYDDAESVGLKIEGFDVWRGTIDGGLSVTMEDSISKVLENHGDKANTYATAMQYKLTNTTEENIDELTSDYQLDMLGHYLSMLKADYDYLTSQEAIADSICANEYEFLEDGTLYN